MNRLIYYVISACFRSENDSSIRHYQLHDRKKAIFRYRNDDFIYVKRSDISKFDAVTKNIETNVVKVSMLKGPCIIIDNKRIFHGRTAFLGDRVVYRILVRVYD